jgi:DNA-directed RNA polymerase specialized sigma24 family protein
MAQILDPLPEDSQSTVLCCYVNATSQIQVARITNIPKWYFERVVFPGQRLIFEGERDYLRYNSLHSSLS